MMRDKTVQACRIIKQRKDLSVMRDVLDGVDLPIGATDNGGRCSIINLMTMDDPEVCNRRPPPDPGRCNAGRR